MQGNKRQWVQKLVHLVDNVGALKKKSFNVIQWFQNVSLCICEAECEADSGRAGGSKDPSV